MPTGSGISCCVEVKRSELRINVERTGAYHIQTLIQAFGDTNIKCCFQTGDFEMRLDRMETMRRMEMNVITLEAGMQECSLTVKEGEVLLYSMELFPAPEPEQREYCGLELCHIADQIEGDISIDRVEGMQMDRKGHVLPGLEIDFIQMVL